MPPRRVSSYTRNAPRPVVGSYWAWMGEIPPVLTRVTKVRWNGEEWWVATRALAGEVLPGSFLPRVYWNDLNVFWEQCHAVAAEPGPPRTAGVRRGPPLPDEMELPQ